MFKEKRLIHRTEALGYKTANRLRNVSGQNIFQVGQRLRGLGFDRATTDKMLGKAGFDLGVKQEPSNFDAEAFVRSQQPRSSSEVTDLGRPAPIEEEGSADGTGGTYGDTTGRDTTYEDSQRAKISDQQEGVDYSTSVVDDLLAEQEMTGAQLRADREAKGLEYGRQLEQSFAPRYAQIQKDTEDAQNTSDRFSAAAGSARGTRQQGELQKISDKGAQVANALRAEQQLMQMQYEASLRGADEDTMAAIADRISTARGVVDEEKRELAQLEDGIHEDLFSYSEELKAGRQESIASALEAQGLVLDPRDGLVKSTLEGLESEADVTKTLSDAGLSDQKAAEITDAINNPDMDVKFVDQGNGNMAVSWVNPKDPTEGGFSIIQGAGSQKRTGGGGAGGAGFSEEDAYFFQLTDEYMKENPGTNFFEAAGAVSDDRITDTQAQNYYPAFKGWQAGVEQEYQDYINQTQETLTSVPGLGGLFGNVLQPLPPEKYEGTPSGSLFDTYGAPPTGY
jgi:hypothetical protein